MRLIFCFLLFGVSVRLFGDELLCPHGCGSNKDSNINEVGEILLQNLEKIDFLEKKTTISTDNGDYYNQSYQQEFGGTDSYLLYQGSYSRYWNVIDDEEESEVEEEYYFSRQKSDDSFNGFSETNLSNYLETRSFIRDVVGDIIFVYDCAQTERLQNIENYSLQMTQNQVREESIYLHKLIDFEKKMLEKESDQCIRRVNQISAAQAHIDQIYRIIFNECIHWHKWKGSFYCRGLLSFQEGYFIDAFDDISEYLKSVEKEETERLLPDEAYFYQGIYCSLIKGCRPLLDFAGLMGGTT